MEEETPLSYQQSQGRALVPQGFQRAPLPPGTEVAFGQMGGDRQGGVRQLPRGKNSIDSGKATKREKSHRENSQVTMGVLLDRTSQVSPFRCFIGGTLKTSTQMDAQSHSRTPFPEGEKHAEWSISNVSTFQRGPASELKALMSEYCKTQGAVSVFSYIFFFFKNFV